jgi:opacity protein-like surface antigen
MRIVITFSILCLVDFCFSQRQNLRSRSEIGVFFGGAYYIGDLNPTGHFKNSKFAYGGMYRFNVHSRLAIRANFTYGNVLGDDVHATIAVNKNRNLSFKSEIYEGAAGIEFNYFPFQIGHSKYKATPYLLAEIGLFHMNPKTKYNGDWIELQPIGTEGQGTSLNQNSQYRKTQFVIPLGLGFRVSLSDRVSFGLEYGIRKTFTDYLDDVGSSNYVDPILLSEISGPLAADLSNRSLDGSRFGRRGNSATKDWYSFFGMTLSMKVGNPSKCFYR